MGGELEVTVYLDWQLDLKATKSLRRGATVADLKAELAREDPTGETRADDFVLAPAPGRGAAAAPLGDGVVLTEALAELVVHSQGEGEAEEAGRPSDAEQARLRAEYEAQIEQLKALGVQNLPPPPPDLDEEGPEAGAAEDLMQRLAMQRILDEQNSASEAAEELVPARPRWEVVGGGDRGGILVRGAQDLASAQLPERLSTGALVEELELVGERLHYARLTGEGPASGWVSTRLKGKELLVRRGGVVGELATASGAAGGEARWQDLDGQAVGPWRPHADRVTMVLFDRLAVPPGASRRLFTCCWSEARACCWELSRGQLRGGGRPPRPAGELATGGLVAAMAALSAHGLLTAVSANPPPETGSVCHQADFKQRMAEQDDRLGPGDTLLAWDVRGLPGAAPAKVPLHKRGCHQLSLWPPPADDCSAQGSGPQLVASVSSDLLAVSRVRGDGLGLEPPAWRAAHPHGPGGEARHVCWTSADHLWSGDRAGTLKLWDVGSGAAAASCEVPLALHSFAHLAAQPGAGLLLAAHEDGVGFLDARARKLLRTQYTKDPVAVVRASPGDFTGVFAGVGASLVQYEARMLAGGGLDSKSKAVGMWTLPSKVLALDCLRSASGNVLVAVGCQDGSVAAFDTA